MATSTFGKATPFHPTPSTCYPPPPPPPLPYDVPCLKGPTTLPLNQRGWIRFLRPIPGQELQLQIPTSGIPTKGSSGGNDTWTLNISSAQLVWCTIKLICDIKPPGIHYWRYTIDGLAIMPDGTFCTFTRAPPMTDPADDSLALNWNDIRATGLLIGTNPVPWIADTQQQQWFTTGAPPIP